MRVAVSGSTGLIGEALVSHLRSEGHTPVRMRRSSAGARSIRWSPEGGLNPADLEGIDAVVHLAGEPIGGGRWTNAHKRRVKQSRVDGTTVIAEAMARADGGPRVLVSQSAVGYYGDRGDEVLTEDSPAGTGFLADVVMAWEAAADPAREAGIRVVHPRTGLVLSSEGGALARMLPLFKAGLGGPFGRGNQWWPWITIEDVARGLLFAVHSELDGPVNFTGPQPVTNRQFATALGDVLHRPALLPVPKLGPGLLFGFEMANEMLWASQRALPARLEEAGFAFAHPELLRGLAVVLGT